MAPAHEPGTRPKGKPSYRRVGPVNPVRTKGCIRVIEADLAGEPGPADAAADALRSVEADMPGLRFPSGGRLLGAGEAAARLRGAPEPDDRDGLLRAVLAALRKVLDRLPPDAQPPRAMATVGQIRDALAGYPADKMVDFQTLFGLPPGGRFRAGAVVPWGEKGSPHSGVTVVEWRPPDAASGSGDED